MEPLVGKAKSWESFVAPLVNREGKEGKMVYQCSVDIIVLVCVAGLVSSVGSF